MLKKNIQKCTDHYEEFGYEYHPMVVLAIPCTEDVFQRIISGLNGAMNLTVTTFTGYI